jgi:hypothetical protein
MGGFVTWIGIGITGFLAGWEGVVNSNPILAAKMSGITIIVFGVARKIEKVIKAVKN